MQSGKFLSIGAALSAGLLAAHVASASVVTGVKVAFGSSSSYTSASAYTGGGVFYSVGSVGSGAYGIGTSTPGGDTTLFSWTKLNLSAPSAGSLGFSVVGLQFGGGGYAANFVATGTSFTSLAANPNTLEASGGGAYSGSAGSSSFTVSYEGFAAKSNGSYDISGDNTGQTALVGSGGNSYTASTSKNTGVSDLAAPYSLTYQLKVGDLSSGGSLGTSASPLGGTVSILGGTPSAVTLPGSGPLSLVGGLVVVGGLAIRRRMKL